jgi:hypothetical protein
MNIHTFKDAVSSKRATFADEVQDDDDDEREAAPLRRAVEGEEEDAKEQVESPFKVAKIVETNFSLLV